MIRCFNKNSSIGKSSSWIRRTNSPFLNTFDIKSNRTSSFFKNKNYNVIQNQQIRSNHQFHSDADTFRNIVMRRWACRHYEDKPIEDEVLKDILSVTQRTPTGWNLQPWVAVVVQNEDSKKELRRACLGQSQPTEAPATVVFGGNTRPVDNLDRTSKMSLEYHAINEHYEKILRSFSTMMLDAGPCSVKNIFKATVLSIVGLFSPVPTVPIDMRAYAAKHTMLAVQTFMYAAASHGLDTTPMEGIDENKVRNVVGLPRHFTVPCVVSVGHGKTNAMGQTPRVPPEEQYFTDTFHQSMQGIPSLNSILTKPNHQNDENNNNNNNDAKNNNNENNVNN